MTPLVSPFPFVFTAATCLLFLCLFYILFLCLFYILFLCLFYILFLCLFYILFLCLFYILFLCLFYILFLCLFSISSSTPTPDSSPGSAAGSQSAPPRRRHSASTAAAAPPLHESDSMQFGLVGSTSHGYDSLSRISLLGHSLLLHRAASCRVHAGLRGCRCRSPAFAPPGAASPLQLNLLPLARFGCACTTSCTAAAAA